MSQIFDNWELKLPLDKILFGFYKNQPNGFELDSECFSHVKRVPFPYFLNSTKKTIHIAQHLSSAPLTNHTSQFDKRCTHHKTPSISSSFDHSLFSTTNFSELANQIPYSLVISHIEKNQNSLQHFCNQLTEKYDCPLGVNAYITPAHSKTFNCHFDPHDIFVLQIFGAKRWTVYKPKMNLEDNLEVLLDVTLHPGEILFIPEGYFHEAESLDSLSLHYSFGFYEASKGKTIEWMKNNFSHYKLFADDKNQFKNLNFLYQLRHQRINQTNGHFLIFKSLEAKMIIVFTFNKEIHLSYDLHDWLLETLTSINNSTEMSTNADLEPIRNVLVMELVKSSS